MNDDLNLSHLLEEVQPPTQGAANIRKAAIARRHRRQAMFTGVAAIFFVAIGISGVMIATARQDRVVVTQDAGFQNETTVTTSSTTTTNPRPNYIGLIHSELGDGLPVGTSIKGSAIYMLPAYSDTQLEVGDYMWFWTEDRQGNMVWLEKITRLESGSKELQSKVVGVYDIPGVLTNEAVCMSGCVPVTTDGKLDFSRDLRKVIAIYDTQTKKASFAAEFDFDKKTLKEISAEGISSEADLSPTAPERPADVPLRPQLYTAIPNLNQEAINWLREFDGLEIRGGGTTESGESYVDLRDTKEGKSVFVIRKGEQSSYVSTDLMPEGNFHYPSEYQKSGDPSLKVLTYSVDTPQNNDPEILKTAWVYNDSTVTFTEIPLSQATLR